ncbi:glycosyltransferase [Streptomyces sp. JV180]|uniref:glycosyltransferase n=1 Tax=Streptomyces sp. JV180 TaxID=858634 RepID=UPI00168BB8C6|nr:glycosyltransferase [Streptomyces sp. JV180]MBD3550005.1 glycosyltransferase [Streptomyces sp. JV180]
MKMLSILTAVHPGALPYLGSAYASLDSQVMPDGWTWEWCIQEDGADVGAREALPAPDDPRIRIGSSRKGGPAVARTMALARSSGEMIKVLDADDELTAGALARDIGALTAHPRIGWTTSRVLDLMPDGSLLGFEGDPPAGLIERGAVLTHWRQHRRAQVHPATLCMRRDLVVLLGGWMALPASEDTGLLTALSVLSEGYFTPEPGLRYRKHSGQSTAHPDHGQGAEWAARMSIIEARADALAALLDR